MRKCTYRHCTSGNIPNCQRLSQLGLSDKTQTCEHADSTKRVISESYFFSRKLLYNGGSSFSTRVILSTALNIARPKSVCMLIFILSNLPTLSSTSKQLMFIDKEKNIKKKTLT